MGLNQPITLGSAAVMALLAAPVQAQTPTSSPTPAPGPAPAVPLAKPATPFSKPTSGPSEGSGVAAPPPRAAPAGLAPRAVVEPLILWQPEGSTSPRPASTKPPSGPHATPPGRPPGGAGSSAAGGSRPNGLVDPFAPMGPGAGNNPFLPGMATQGPGSSGMDPRRMGGPRIPGGGPPRSGGPQQRMRLGPNGRPLPPGAGSLGGPQGAMPEGMMLPPGTLPPGVVPPPGAVPPGMMPPGAMPPGAGRSGPGALPPGAMPPGALPPGVVPPGIPAPESRSPAAGVKSSTEWSPWPSLLATLGLGGGGVLLAFLARRRSASVSASRVAMGEEGRKNAPQGPIQTGDRSG
jgi:hypothetical protein